MRKGFTLIELLAVIVILAIIALIAVPIVLGIIDDAKKSSVVRSGEFYIKGLELAIANSALTPDTQVRDGEYSIINGNVCLGTIAGTGENRTCNGELLEVEINGEVPSEGLVAISNGQVAYVEGLKIGNTKISSGVEGLAESENRVVCEAVTNDNKTTGNVPKGKYENGDEYLCEVKPGTTYHFFVISKEDTGEINLIMDRNITSKGTPVTKNDLGLVAWVTKVDYDAANIDGTNTSICNNNTCIDEGAITLSNKIVEYVSNWSNIKEIKYNKNIDVYGPQSDGSVLIINGQNEIIKPYVFNKISRARLMTVEEAAVNGCKVQYDSTNESGETVNYYTNTCPLYLSNHLEHKRGYVTGNNVVNSQSGIRGYWLLNGVVDAGWNVHDNGDLNSRYATDDNYNGVRPVITISKNNIK